MGCPHNHTVYIHTVINLNNQNIIVNVKINQNSTTIPPPSMRLPPPPLGSSLTATWRGGGGGGGLQHEADHSGGEQKYLKIQIQKHRNTNTDIQQYLN